MGAPDDNGLLSHPALAKRCSKRGAGMAEARAVDGCRGSQQSINCSGARQVLVLKRIPMKNSSDGVEHRQD
ncbi:hypothetical protein LPB72_11600 [Hydrogenophaga crassostreae]|uniref:Uncharacterized protein n=1 Tax=Hydrogenophaga crassostreae TaxID=1763535 RepID=A0A162P6U6_9BURK|nr:hypothetical protein LPB072_12980 [Hydrogenophaga crassostreae]OAD41924.1 hypothetical protein LPB72_11600 [Hydrogenophaga crassostreae]